LNLLRTPFANAPESYPALRVAAHASGDRTAVADRVVAREATCVFVRIVVPR